ncbi:MAG: hypothetical protein ACKVOK_07175 [Flavobacteriales bacterium]
MNLLRFLLIIFSILISSGMVHGQKERKNPSKQENQVTPENAKDQERANMENKQKEYVTKKNYHTKNQDKATQKRMKKNLRRAEKHSWGKDIPWYKRWFRKKRLN